VRIVYDEPKRLANLDKHGLDFAALDAAFFENSLIIAARGNRFKAIGKHADGTISVIFAALGIEAISIISMRPAGVKERRLSNDSQEGI